MQKRLFKELLILLAVLFVSYLLTAEGPDNFRYPMSANPQVKQTMQRLGTWFAYLGYPLIAAVRLVRFYINRK